MSGAILCGGASRRMGRDKALVAIDGLSMVLHVAAAVRAAGCAPVRAIGGDRLALEALGLEVVDDHSPGEGPLGGVISALAESSPDVVAVLVVACDLPRLSSRTVSAVVASLGDADVAVARTDRLQPMCALWRVAALPMLRRSFDAGERRVDSVFATLRVVEVSVNPQDLANVNTPGDLHQ